MFKLLIESSKDITSLSINFADGTVQTVEGPEGPDITESQTPEVQKSRKSRKSKKPKNHTEDSFTSAKDELLDLSADFGSYNSGKVQKPEIQEVQREIKVASELQNLDI